MSNNVKKQLVEAGVEIDEALSRFMDSDMLYFKFLKLFLNDKSYSNLNDAIAKGDIGNAYVYAHTLKGVTSNLSFNRFLEALMPMHNSLKDGISKDYSNDLKILEDQYNELVKIINEID